MPEKVLDLLNEMTIEPNNFTLTLLFNACARVANDRAMRIGRKLLDKMPNDFRNDTVVLTSAAHMLMKFGEAESAEHVVKVVRNRGIITILNNCCEASISFELVTQFAEPTLN
ncbi:unnamed protein product [Rotaria sordida]|uniref:Pentatricopeptide repeat-containing protein n=1 Tax=Rotaria sordida TaxID=392033 RepID=A0A814I480_9BILA|nr:unnamed protein product [Rotaria sordida]